MGSFVVIGEESYVRGFALGGATVVAVEDVDEVRRAFSGLDDDVAVVLLTARAAAVLGDEVSRRDKVLSVVMPP